MNPIPLYEDVTETPLWEIKEMIRERGWEGFHIDTRRYKKEGRVFIRRLKRREK